MHLRRGGFTATRCVSTKPLACSPKTRIGNLPDRPEQPERTTCIRKARNSTKPLGIQIRSGAARSVRVASLAVIWRDDFRRSAWRALEWRWPFRAGHSRASRPEVGPAGSARAEAGLAVGQFPGDVEVPGMPGSLLDHVQHDPAHVRRLPVRIAVPPERPRRQRGDRQYRI